MSLNEAPRLLVGYTDVGLLLGLYDFGAYLVNWKTGILFNLPAYSLYSSLPVALVIIVGPGGWLPALILASVLSFAVSYVLEYMGLTLLTGVRGPDKCPGSLRKLE